MSERLIVLDCETYPTRNEAVCAEIAAEIVGGDDQPKSVTKEVKRVWAAMGKPEPSKKEFELLWDTEEVRAARCKDALWRTALDPMLAELLCVVWTWPGRAFCASADCMGARVNGEPVLDGSLAANEEEALELLAMEWDKHIGPETILVGHNIAGFDLPIILNRWRRWGIKPPKHFPAYYNGRWGGRVFDTMLRTPAKTPFVSLKDACRAYAVPGAKSVEWEGAPMDGSRVAAAFEAGERDLILRYCESDVIVTLDLYQRMTAGDTWGTWDTRDEVAEAIAEIEAGGLTDGARAISILQVLERNGLVPRAA